jgi:hypothetical protein
MNNFGVPINFNLFETIYGKQLFDIFKYLNITNFLDVNKFIENQKFYPEIGSIWLYGQGGSYHFHDDQLGTVVINNGTLWQVDNINIPFGNEYYQAYFNVPMITSRKYDENIQQFNTPGSVIEGRKVISFENADRMLENQQIKNYYLEPRLQTWSGDKWGLSRNNSIITLVDNNDNFYLIRAMFNHQTQQAFPPK